MKIDIVFNDDRERRSHAAQKIPSYYWTKLFCTPIDTNQDRFFPQAPSRPQSLSEAFRGDITPTEMGITLFEDEILDKGARNTYFDVLNTIKHDSEIRDDAQATLRIWVCWLVSDDLPVSEWLRAKECPISLRMHIAILLGRLELAQQLVTQAQSDETKLNCQQVATICLVLRNPNVIACKDLFLKVKNWLDRAADFTADLEKLESSKNSVVKLENNSDLLNDINSIVSYFKTYNLYVINYSNPASITERPQIEFKLDRACNQVKALSLIAARAHDYLSIEVLTSHALELLDLGDIFYSAFSAGDATLFAKMTVNNLIKHLSNHMDVNHLSEKILCDARLPRKLKDEKIEKGLDWYLWLLDLLPLNFFDRDNIKKSIQIVLSEARPRAVLQSRVDDDNDDNNNAYVAKRPRYTSASSNTLFAHQTTAPVAATVQATIATTVPNPLSATNLTTTTTVLGVSRSRPDDNEPDFDESHQDKRPKR